MTDNQMVATLKKEAVNVLLKTTFAHIQNDMHESYCALAKQNSEILGRTHNLFMYDGKHYPIEPVAYMYQSIPHLHHLLINDLEQINSMLNKSGYQFIKNYFTAVISNSFNKIVLNELLPVVLITELKNQYSVDTFEILDSGVYNNSYKEPIEATRINIANIKANYSSTLVMLQQLLMEKLLLQH